MPVYQYKVMRECYWNFRRYTPDMSPVDVNISDGDTPPPYHFVPLDGGPARPAPENNMYGQSPKVTKTELEQEERMTLFTDRATQARPLGLPTSDQLRVQVHAATDVVRDEAVDRALGKSSRRSRKESE